MPASIVWPGARGHIGATTGLAPAFALFALPGPGKLRGNRVEPVMIRADGAALSALSALAAAGKLTLRVADTYPLEHVVKAHERLEAGGLRGRLVLVP